MAVNAKYGTPIKRREDPTLIQGRVTTRTTSSFPARCTSRSSARASRTARSRTIDASAAKESPGVVAVYTADDLGLNDLPNAGPPVPSPETMRRPILASDRVRFIGEAIAVVVAETRAQAVDAVDLVEVDVDDLPGARRHDEGARRRTRRSSSPEHGSNLAAEAPLGAAGALDDAEVVDHQPATSTSAWRRSRWSRPRRSPRPIRRPAACGCGRRCSRRTWVRRRSPARWASSRRRSASRSRPSAAASAPASPPTPSRSRSPRSRSKLEQPVRYVESRWETMLVDAARPRAGPGRRARRDASDGTLTGIQLRVIADCGAYPADATLMPLLTGLMASGVYRIPKVDFACQAVVTNTTPIGAYRGAGPPGGDGAARAGDGPARR